MSAIGKDVAPRATKPDATEFARRSNSWKSKMSPPPNTRLPVGNKDFTHATVVIIGAGISGEKYLDLLRLKTTDP